MTDIIFIDKDNTLGDFHTGGCGIYEGVENFLMAQNVLGRRIYVATTASQRGIIHLEKVMSLFAGYLGREQIDATHHSKYILPDGSIRNIDDDFALRSQFCSEEEAKRLYDKLYELHRLQSSFPSDSAEYKRIEEELNFFLDHSCQLLHKETREPFDESRRYQNPYTLKGTMAEKDLFLARRIISPDRYIELRTVMIGDGCDILVPLHDPETPLIVISGDVRCGSWNIPEVIVNRLFSTPDMPWQVHDALFSEALPTSRGKNRECSIDGILFTFEKGEMGERRIYCP
jgi:hypothetical protein